MFKRGEKLGDKNLFWEGRKVGYRVRRGRCPMRKIL